MNPRIHKKLTKKAAIIIDQIGQWKHLHKVIVDVDGVESVETNVKVDLKHRDRWFKDKHKARREFKQLAGTVGYGCVSGYEYSEWEDSCAWSILRNYIIESFTDWGSFSGEGWPENHCPRRVKASPHGVFNHARQLLNIKAGAA